MSAIKQNSWNLHQQLRCTFKWLAHVGMMGKSSLTKSAAQKNRGTGTDETPIIPRPSLNHLWDWRRKAPLARPVFAHRFLWVFSEQRNFWRKKSASHFFASLGEGESCQSQSLQLLKFQGMVCSISTLRMQNSLAKIPKSTNFYGWFQSHQHLYQENQSDGCNVLLVRIVVRTSYAECSYAYPLESRSCNPCSPAWGCLLLNKCYT